MLTLDEVKELFELIGGDAEDESVLEFLDPNEQKPLLELVKHVQTRKSEEKKVSFELELEAIIADLECDEPLSVEDLVVVDDAIL